MTDNNGTQQGPWFVARIPMGDPLRNGDTCPSCGGEAYTHVGLEAMGTNDMKPGTTYCLDPLNCCVQVLRAIKAKEEA